MKKEPKAFEGLKLILGILLGIGLGNVVTEHQAGFVKTVKVESDELVENYSLPIDESIEHEEVDIGQESIEIKQREGLEEMLAVLQKEYIHMYRGREADNMGDENNRYILIKDLEEVHFYQDEKGEVIIETAGMGLHEGNFLPPIPNIASQGTLMDETVRAERLVISLTVNEEDEVKELGIAPDKEGINVMHYYLK